MTKPKTLITIGVANSACWRNFLIIYGILSRIHWFISFWCQLNRITSWFPIEPITHRPDSNTDNDRGTVHRTEYIHLWQFHRLWENFWYCWQHDMTTLWYNGVSKKFTALVKDTFEGMSCIVRHRSQKSKPFSAWAGLRQGCFLSPIFILLAITGLWEQPLLDTREMGIRRIDLTEDLDFVDDLLYIPTSIITRNIRPINQR